MISASEESIRLAVSSSGDDCILWPLSRRNGYGQAYVPGSNDRYAHRHVLRRVIGEPPIDKPEAAHSCGNRACVNPRHLRWASRQENSDDVPGHGRRSEGARRPKAKLTPTDVLYIRESSDTLVSLAEKFGVAFQTVSLARLGKTWKCVK